LIDNIGLGRYVNLTPIKTDQKTMQISLHSFHLLQNHSIEYHSAEDQPISYDQCIQELCNFWNSEHGQNHIHFGGTRN
jgi:hypothetical protein